MTTKLTEKNISSVANAGINWQSVIVADGSTGTTGVAGRGYFINTTSAAHTFTLPATATFADTILIKDYAGTFATNKLTIARNGHNIQGAANNSLIGTNRASVVLVYVDVTRGWEFVTESNVANLEAVAFISATGGTVLTDGDFKTHVFTGDGSFVVSCAGGVGPGPSSVDYLVVAGGGGTNHDRDSGGGAGGFRISNFYSLPAPTTSPLASPTGLTVSVQSYPITVGAGGAAVAPGTSNPGSPAVFSTITSTGGGGSNQNGGSGGGGRCGPDAGGTGNTPPVSPPQGNPGGDGLAYNQGTGGGGGAGAVGNNGIPSQGGAGGIGSFIADSFIGPTAPSYGAPGPVGSTRYFAGGGGGAKYPAGPAGAGGIGGGGAGGPGSSVGTSGTANTGGGAGGSGANGGTAPNGASGGRGIILIRYKFQ